MKGSTVATIIGVVVIVLIVGLFTFRETEAPTVSPTPEAMFEDIGEESDVMIEDTMEEDTGSMSDEASDASVSDQVSGEEVTISVDESGFTPATLTIQSGTTVTFVNNGQAPHWPASDIHPTHEILPELDSKGALQTGETFSYTFTDVGTWSVHDHLAPRNVGSITVE